jgi:hypothetical protein
MRNVTSKIINKIKKPRSITPISVQVAHNVREQAYVQPWTQVQRQVSIQMKTNLKFKL